MHTHDLRPWQHEHVFDVANPTAERSTWLVMWITAAMMVLEIVAGWWFISMALLADGWHMSSHALAIGLSAFAYAMARRHAHDGRYAFGTWKIEVLGGFASAILLLGIAALMAWGSVERLLQPQAIHFQQAIAVAVVGLVVNVVCAMILGRSHAQGADHEHAHAHGHAHDHHHDLNLRSAYVHVVADAATSVLAIVALAGGLLWGWAWLDPVMGLVGSVLVAIWAWRLVRSTSDVLLDREMEHPVVAEIREAVEGGDAGEARVSDLHVWRVGKNSFACALSVVTHDAGLTPAQVRDRLAVHDEVVHATVEIQHCVDTTPSRA